MNPTSWLALAAGAASLAGLLRAETGDRPTARAVFKSVCSGGFLLLALSLGIDSTYARWVLAALVLSALGDLALLSEARRSFLAGLVAFLLAHVAYCIAFAPGSRPSPWTALALVVIAGGVLRWLWPGLGAMRVPVVVYCAVISAMLWLAIDVDRNAARAGAALFYVSDLAVARQKFVAPGVVNRLVGLPLYYAGQYLLAASIAGP